MIELQVKWIPKKTSPNQASSLDNYDIEIDMIKAREVILQKKFESSKLIRYMIVPLYEQ